MSKESLVICPVYNEEDTISNFLKSSAKSMFKTFFLWMTDQLIRVRIFSLNKEMAEHFYCSRIMKKKLLKPPPNNGDVLFIPSPQELNGLISENIKIGVCQILRYSIA